MSAEDEADGAGDEAEARWPGRPMAVNQADLLRGTICGGQRQAVTLLRDPPRREREVRGFAGLLDAYVSFGEEGPQRTAFFDELDSREKAAFSYRVGLGVGLLMAQRELAIPWIIHVGSLLTSGSAQMAPEERQPGVMVGLSRDGRWHVVKARARSSEMSDSLVRDALDDVAEVAMVNGETPDEQRACVSSLGEAPFRVSFVGLGATDAADREGEVPDGDEVELKVDPSALITEYYAQFSFLTSLTTRRRGFDAEVGCGNLPPVVVADLTGTGYEIGLLEPLYNALLPPGESDEAPEDLNEAIPTKRGWEAEDPDAARRAGLSIGRDGVVVSGPEPGEDT